MGLFSKLFGNKNQDKNISASPDENWSTYKTTPTEPLEQTEPYSTSQNSNDLSGSDIRMIYNNSGIAKTYKLVSSGTKSIQQNITSDLIDCEVAIQLNSETGKYSVFCNDLLIGYLSKAAIKSFEELFIEEHYLAFVDSFDTDSKDNFIPRIAVFIPGSPFVIRQHDWEPTSIPTSRPDYSHRITPVGIAYGCKKSSFRSRQSVIRKLKLGDIVDVEEYTYKGKPAYMFVDRKSGLDFGVMQADEAAHVSKTWKIKRFEAYVIYTGTCRGYDYDLEDYTTQHTCDVHVYFFK